jgi:hypothetical protein
MTVGKVIPSVARFEKAKERALKNSAERDLGPMGRKRMVILCTEDPDAEVQDWFLVNPDQVPEYLLDSEVMGNMASGLLAQPPDSHLWYRAESLVTYEATLQRTYAAQKYQDG